METVKTETKKEGESEGETEHRPAPVAPVDNVHPLAARAAARGVSPSSGLDSGFVEGQRATSSAPAQFGATPLPPLAVAECKGATT